MTPDLIYLSARASQDLTEAGLDTVLYSDCNYNWSENSSKVFQFVKTILLYLLPFILMFCAHFKIMRTLQMASTTEQKQIQQQQQQQNQHQDLQRQQQQKIAIFIEESCVVDLDGNLIDNLDCETKTNTNANGTASSPLLHDNTSLKLDESLDNKQNSKSIIITTSNSNNHYSNNNQQQQQQQQDGIKVTMHNKTKLESRRKAANMLMAIVIMFGICYLPVHLINFLR